MLCELRVKNLALIESLSLGFEQECNTNLVVMTGETGAGKSIMLRAIHLLSGRRASVDWIRSGEESCVVEALFDVNPQHSNLQQKLSKGGFGNDTTLIIKRVVQVNGRSRFYVNGSFATGKLVSELTSELLNVAGQHDQQQLLQPATHLDFLDTIGEHWQDRLQLKSRFQEWQEKKLELETMRQQEQEKEQRQDFLRFQVAEIREADPQPDEDEQLVAEKKRLKNAQTLIELSQESYRLLSGELLDSLALLRNNVTQLGAIDQEAVKLSEEISGFTFMAEDHVQSLREYKDSLESDPYRLDLINERLDLLVQLKRKYGQTISEILEFAKDGEKELQRLENMQEEVASLSDEVDALEKEVCALGGALSKKRKKTALLLEKSMAGELASLAFDRPGFQVRWEEVVEAPENLRATGWDKGEFLFSANTGEAPKPLAKVASGGELSRLMLAMMCILAKKDMVETVIFDEVDAGIGGEAAEAVARKIQELSGHHQVFCITHLPQIAARGTLHFQVEKTVEKGRTRTKVEKLSNSSRVAEIVRMLAGESATEQTEAWAEELLAKGKGSVCS